MENLEEDLTDLQNNSSSLEMERVVAQAAAAANLSSDDSHNDSVQIIETPIEVLDLTSPQPSTSSSSTSSSSSSNSAGAATALVGAASLVKRNLEEALKEERNTTDSSPLDQNPSTSNSSAATTSSSSGNNSNTGNILECPICLQTCIHPARLPCGHIFCFLCVKGVAYKNRRCAMCRREIPPEFLDHPQLVNGIEDICTTKATDDGYQWFYEGRNGGWWAYEKRNACEIEAAFQSMFNKRIDNRKPHKIVEMENEGIKTEQQIKDELDINIEVEVDEQDFDSENDDGEGEANDNKNNEVQPLTYDILICGTMYTVDFQNMVQYPQAMPYRKRKICRAKGLPAKGVAGLKVYKRNRRSRPY